MTRLCLLWHFHQPDYRDPQTGAPVLPWVRHHALRGYRDLPLAIAEHGASMAINLVPTLVEQVAWYAGGGSDPWLDRVRTPAEELDEQGRQVLLRDGFAGHPALVEAAPPWRELRLRRDQGRAFGPGALRDLQVWSILGWTGWSARRDHPELAGLVARGCGFTEDDKATLLSVQRRICVELPELWRAVPEVSASPWSHPILPLLVDARHGCRCLPELPPVDFAWPGDARLQLTRGKRAIEALLGREVTGLWPPEGAVSPEVVELAVEAGFSWLASDEGVLERSERRGAGRGPWTLAKGLAGFFRDRHLSDHIGFRTAGRDPAQSVTELLDGVAARDGLVTLVLDGENPWESHPDAGHGFMQALGEALGAHPGVQAVGFAEAASDTVGTVERVHTGGWINGDFAIWIGDEADREAWSLLGETRRAVREAGDPPEALAPVLAAEGSDWFWWYGPEFHTEHLPDFDRLFRTHLLAAWRALGRRPPARLLQPVGTTPAPLRDRDPLGAVRPGEPRAWWGAGSWDARRPGGSMAGGVQAIDRVLYGVGDGSVHVRLDPRTPLPPLAGATLRVALSGASGEQVFEAAAAELEHGPLVHSFLAEVPGHHRLSVQVRRGGEVLQALPDSGSLGVDVPSTRRTWRGGWP